MISGIHHVQISVNKGEGEKACEFYSRVLGFKNLTRPKSLSEIPGAWLEKGKFQIHIREERSEERQYSSNHVAYEVEGLENWRQKLEDTGIETIPGIEISGMSRFEFRHPFGNRIEMLELQ